MGNRSFSTKNWKVNNSNSYQFSVNFHFQKKAKSFQKEPPSDDNDGSLLRGKCGQLWGTLSNLRSPRCDQIQVVTSFNRGVNLPLCTQIYISHSFPIYSLIYLSIIYRLMSSSICIKGLKTPSLKILNLKIDKEQGQRPPIYTKLPCGLFSVINVFHLDFYVKVDRVSWHGLANVFFHFLPIRLWEIRWLIQLVLTAADPLGKSPSTSNQHHHLH